jgi:hypothetical protein
MSVEYITVEHEGWVQATESSCIITIGFVPSIIDTHKRYYLPNMDIDYDSFYELNHEQTTWHRLIVWNVPDVPDEVAKIHEVFRRIGGYTRVERIYDEKYGDDTPLTIWFDTWNVNEFTNRLVAELTMCDIYNQRVSSYDKRYVTMVYQFDDKSAEREVFVELSWEN